MGRLDEERDVWVSSVRPDGRPHLVPVWFVWAHKAFWVGTGRSSVKHRNVQHQPEVVMALEDGDDPLVAVCRVSEVEQPPDDVVATFARKYGWDLTQVHDEDVGERVIWRADLVRWLMGSPDAG